MASADVERIIEEVRRLTRDERHRLRAELEREERRNVLPAETSIDLATELRWIDEHRSEYAGQWVAVRGSRLLSSGPDGKKVFEAARAAGDDRPFVTRVAPADELPFAGW